MTHRKFKHPKSLYVLISFLFCALAIPLVWIIIIFFEGESPTFQMENPTQTIGTSYTLKGWASDQKSGLRRVWITIFQQGKEQTLLDQKFPSKGFLRGGGVLQPISLNIRTDRLDLEDGQALLRIAVWDYSYRGWWTGNQTYAEHKILIDTKPPAIDVLSRTHNLNQGGTGLAIYKISETDTINGVQVADRLFPGHTGFSGDPHLYIAFFAVPYDKGTETELHVIATDHAGNTGKASVPYNIHPRSFSKDTISLADTFLRRKIPEFESGSYISDPSASPIEKFIVINRELRQANHKSLQAVSKQTDTKLYWEGPFLRLPRSECMAGFGDHRKYLYEGRAVDEQVHLGMDLASTRHAPVPAANNGRVALAKYIGIYGKTILLDHGFGLFSIYGHLSRIEVTKDQVVSKGEVIGHTGMTGLAGGDHLHYAMMVGHTLVNPLEWWDPNWIKHNVSNKLKAALPGDGSNEALQSPKDL